MKTSNDHRSYTYNLSSYENKARKKKKDLGRKGIRTHNLCDTDAVPTN